VEETLEKLAGLPVIKKIINNNVGAIKMKKL